MSLSISSSIPSSSMSSALSSLLDYSDEVPVVQSEFAAAAISDTLMFNFSRWFIMKSMSVWLIANNGC